MTATLLLGDCLDLMPSIPDGSVDAIICDLPYGVTACKWDSVIPLEPLWKEYKRIIKRNGAIVLTASQPFTSALVMSNLPMFRYEWVWEKNRGGSFAVAKYQPMKEHESVLVFGIGRLTYNPQPTKRSEGGSARCKYKVAGYGSGAAHGFIPPIAAKQYDSEYRLPRSIVRINTEVGLHPTQKPVALMEYLIRTYTNEGETVLDNTCGSGTTLVAAINTGRHSIGIERDEGYFQIAKQRIQEAEQAARQLTMELTA